MIRPRSLLALRLACVVAIGVSVALLIDSLRPAPAFCVTGSGCDQIRKQGYGVIAGVPVSALGLGAYGALLTLSFFSEARRLTAWAALAGGAIGLGLIALQAFVVHAFCKLCLIVDFSALAAAVAGLFLLRDPAERRDDGRLVWVGSLAAALGLPWALAAFLPAVPSEVRQLWKPGQVNIVEFSDFECPFCRQAHPRIEAARRAVPEAHVNLVRRTLPLALHPHARDASRAYLCADAQGKGDDMADRLFTGDLTARAIAEHAALAGLDLDAFRACLAGPAVDATLAEHSALVRRADFKGLPTVWINDRRLLGASEEEVYIEALRTAARGDTSTGRQVWPLALVATLSLGFVALGLQSARLRAARA